MVVNNRLTFGKLIIYFLIVALCASIILPFWMIFVSSFTDEGTLVRNGGLILVPASPTLKAYKQVFSDNRIWKSFQSSVFITAAGTLVHLLVTGMMAYPLSKKLKYNTIIGFFVYFTTLFSGGIIPYYILIKNLNLLNTLWYFVITGMLGAYHMILMRNFFAELPPELEESALIDGAGYFKVLYRIVLPLSLPLLATIGLMAMVARWNTWLAPVIYMPAASDRWPLMTTLMLMLQNAFNPPTIDQIDMMNYVLPPKESFKYATLVVATLPIMCVYPFLQKYFAKGLLIGAIKG